MLKAFSFGQSRLLLNGTTHEQKRNETQGQKRNKAHEQKNDEAGDNIRNGTGMKEGNKPEEDMRGKRRKS